MPDELTASLSALGSFSANKSNSKNTMEESQASFTEEKHDGGGTTYGYSPYGAASMHGSLSSNSAPGEGQDDGEGEGGGEGEVDMDDPFERLMHGGGAGNNSE